MKRAINEKIIYVYDSFTFDESKLLGKLFVNTIKGGESYSFEYDKEWLSSSGYPVAIDPDFIGYGGREYPNGRSIFGIFADASAAVAACIKPVRTVKPNLENTAKYEKVFAVYKKIHDALAPVYREREDSL